MDELDDATRAAYQSAIKAKEYHDRSMNARGLRDLRYRLITSWERRAIRLALGQVPHARILDFPVGSGKLAPVLKELNADVTCADVSAEMLRLAKHTYSSHGLEVSSFVVADLANAHQFATESFDVVVCVRLMQRVSDATRRAMLREIARLAPYAIVSFAVTNAYQRMRRRIRRSILGGADVGAESHLRIGETDALVSVTHEVLDRWPIARGISAEWVYSLRAKRSSASSK